MTAVKDTRTADTTRRRLMLVMVGAAGAIGASLASREAAAAQAKLAQTEIDYQRTPKGGQRCELCVNWRPPGACKVVAGSISPAGWCSLFAPKP